jgi:hypothetical protein
MKGKSILLLGAEKQATVSAALAWPDVLFKGLTDHSVIDGWDLNNLQFHAMSPMNFNWPDQNDDIWPLCPRWLVANTKVKNLALQEVFDRLKLSFSSYILNYSSEPLKGGWILKGNYWHLPDGPFTGNDQNGDFNFVTNQKFFQEYLGSYPTKMTIGFRKDSSTVGLGVFDIYRESLGADDLLVAGKTIFDPKILNTSIEMLDFLDHKGFFTFTWIQKNKQYFLSSFRPVPRAVFQTLKLAGVDFFALKENEISLAKAGVSFVVDIHYSSYKRLS